MREIALNVTLLGESLKTVHIRTLQEIETIMKSPEEKLTWGKCIGAVTVHPPRSHPEAISAVQWSPQKFPLIQK